MHLVPLRRVLQLLVPNLGPKFSELCDELETTSPFNPLRLYRLVARAPRAVTAEEVRLASHPTLLPTLRPHQVRAVLWAIEVEKNGVHHQIQRWWEETLAKVVITVQKGIVFNPLTGQITRWPFPFKVPDIAPVHGAILADEMGLGKTVETIALLLAHRPALPRMNVVPPQDLTFKGVVRCFCGSSDSKTLDTVKCNGCLSLQHGICVGFPKSNWYCPNCLEASQVKV